MTFNSEFMTLEEIAEFLFEKESITGKEFVEIYNRVTGKQEPEEIDIQKELEAKFDELFGKEYRNA